MGSIFHEARMIQHEIESCCLMPSSTRTQSGIVCRSSPEDGGTLAAPFPISLALNVFRMRVCEHEVLWSRFVCSPSVASPFERGIPVPEQAGALPAAAIVRLPRGGLRDIVRQEK